MTPTAAHRDEPPLLLPVPAWILVSEEVAVQEAREASTALLEVEEVDEQEEEAPGACHWNHCFDVEHHASFPEDQRSP